MHLTRLKKQPAIFILALITVITICAISCQKELSGESNGSSTELPDLTTKINSAVSGFVMDENDMAVANAVVTIGNSNTLSDKYGFFELKNVSVVKDAAVVTVDYPGYFKAIKTYMAATGKAAFFRIKLISKISAGNIDASTGGQVTLLSGMAIQLPANAVVNAATGNIYSGQVNIAAHWINPSTADLNLTMPGDLRGTDTAGTLKLLTTYGMAAVELTGAGGELLQVATGKKATLTIPLPAGISANAPATIPLWYFDEKTGLWKEEGKAVKSGNSYVGDVNHFSYWNCDVPSNFVKFSCTVTNAKGIPLANAYVKISVVGDPQRTGYGYTDSSGFTSGAVPNNSSLLLEVFGEYNCLSGIYAKNFTTTSSNISLGSIVVPAAYSATVTGNVNNCSNAAVTNGFVIMKKDGLSFCQALSNTGTFSFTTALCNSSAAASFIAEDKAAMKASNAITTTINSGANAVGTLIACGNSTLQFLNYSVNGTNYSFTGTADSLLQYAKPQNTPPSIIISAFTLVPNNTQSVFLGILLTGITVNSSQNLLSFSCPQIDVSATIVTPIAVKITEYGTVGQFIAGDFTGTLRGPSPTNTLYNITCNFRVRRSQ